MDISDTNPDKRYSYFGEGSWRMEWSFQCPSCSMRNDETGESKQFGSHCITSDAFKEITND